MPSPDHLMKIISRSDLMGWMVWAAIRGPIGGPRQDWYHANLAMYAGKPYPEDYEASYMDFLPHWAKHEDDEDEE